MLSNVLNTRFFFWALLALPSIPMTLALLNGATGPQGRPVTEILLHPTGEFAARFMIIAMVITPMRMLLPNSNFWRWMMKRRRYFGVAAFAYALAHTLLYVVDRRTCMSRLRAQPRHSGQRLRIAISAPSPDISSLDFHSVSHIDILLFGK